MKRLIFLISLILLLHSSLFLNTVKAETTAGCHCFKNRVFNPADKFSSDDYILATSYNSLIANYYKIAKKQIVFLKMKGGADPLDLVISLQAEKVSGTDYQKLLNLRKEKKTWKTILFDPAISKQIRADKFLRPLQTGADVSEQGPKIVNVLLSDFFKVTLAEVEKLRTLGLSEKEISLVLVLAKTKSVDSEKLVERRKQQNKSWSEIAHELGITPGEAGKLILGYSTK